MRIESSFIEIIHVIEKKSRVTEKMIRVTDNATRVTKKAFMSGHLGISISIFVHVIGSSVDVKGGFLRSD